MFSLRQTLYATILLMAAILSMVFLLGARQYLLAGRYKAVIDQSEKLLFRFATVKERISEALLENRYEQLSAITLEAEAVNGDLARVLESGLIPGEYKLTFLEQLDLPGVVILLRKISAQPNRETAGQLSAKVRLINDQFMRFDRIVASQAKAGLVEFQSVVIGGLAMVLCLCSFLVLIWYRQVIVPLLGLVARCKTKEFGTEILEHDYKACNELVELTQAVNGLIVAYGRQVKVQSKVGAASEGDFDALFVRLCGLAAIGELAAGVAHEVRNLVNGIINYSQVLFDELGPDGGTRADLLRKVMVEGERIGDELRQLLFLSRGKQQNLSRLPLEHVVQGAYALVERQMKNDGITTTITLASGLPPVEVDLGYLQLVFLCIFNNARQALNARYPGQDKEKRLAITAEVVLSEGRSWLRTSITDWGGGIEAQVLPRVFEPLYSTKPAGTGTGLGLTLSKMLVEDHGGRLRIESVAGDHATVCIELPVAAAG